MSSGTGTNTKQNKISMVPNSASWNLIHSRHTWMPMEQGCTQDQQVTSGIPRTGSQGTAKRSISPFLSQDDWKAVCPKADRQNSPQLRNSPTVPCSTICVFTSTCTLKHGISGLREKGIYGWGKAAGVLEVKVAEVFLPVYLGKESCRIQNLAHKVMLIRAVTWNWENVSQKVKGARNLKLSSSKKENNIKN